MAIGAYGLVGFGAIVLAPTTSILFWVCYLLGFASLVLLGLISTPRLEQFTAAFFAAVCLLLPLVDPVGGLSTVPFVIAAATVALVFSQRVGLIYVGMQILVGMVLSGPDTSSVVNILLITLLSLFAVFVSGIAMREAEARHQLAAAQEKLAETTRATERLRISRDLHDRVGHQLSALALNLEAASHLSGGTPAHDIVEQSRLLAKQALTEIRGVVTQLRDDAPDTFLARLRTFADRIPSPEVRIDAGALSVPEQVTGDLVLATQEAITNAVRHANASHIIVRIRDVGDVISVRVSDDGVGVCQLAVGNGLRGMVERISARSGTVHFDTKPPGFTVNLTVPKGAS
ncbi:hypothetical protein BSZ39_06975 [Bowdeniella nasicola]|uniref:Signal transduction histidine kinase subgroup 3 dimerisation and phosphoacceptor domain-containing protein n=1 Tax=Bowdeniella nasicola TaxID=208480 RepID=A0A1Q5Q2J6_9ACTO|nr:hypothetical protein BSZ39_06975 [Bowdeniella nasicola]